MWVDLSVWGSSPLTRGKLEQGVHDFVGVGLIPAHAGKTHDQGVRALPRRAHPRSRGENGLAGWQPRGACGSSPLTRGKPRVEHIRRVCIGLIPAHAGKTR